MDGNRAKNLALTELRVQFEEAHSRYQAEVNLQVAEHLVTTKQRLSDIESMDKACDEAMAKEIAHKAKLEEDVKRSEARLVRFQKLKGELEKDATSVRQEHANFKASLPEGQQNLPRQPSRLDFPLPLPNPSQQGSRAGRLKRAQPSDTTANGNDDAEDSDDTPLVQRHRRNIGREKKAEPKCVRFNEVYQNGHPKILREIFEFPKASNQWYIIRCEEHNLDFVYNEKDTLRSARNHLKSKDHIGAQGTTELVFKTLGIRVLDCDKAKARKNIEMVSQRIRDAKPESSTTIPPPPISDLPVEGSLYLHVREAGEPATCVVLILPLGDFRPVGFEGHINNTKLVKDGIRPNCYRRNQVNDCLELVAGYEDGGPRAHQRMFPVLYFDGRAAVFRGLGDGLAPVPEGNNLGWLAPANLTGPQNEQTIQTCKNKTKGKSTALKYLASRAVSEQENKDGEVGVGGPDNNTNQDIENSDDEDQPHMDFHFTPYPGLATSSTQSGASSRAPTPVLPSYGLSMSPPPVPSSLPMPSPFAPISKTDRPPSSGGVNATPISTGTSSAFPPSSIFRAARRPSSTPTSAPRLVPQHASLTGPKGSQVSATGTEQPSPFDNMRLGNTIQAASEAGPSRISHPSLDDVTSHSLTTRESIYNNINVRGTSPKDTSSTTDMNSPTPRSPGARSAAPLQPLGRLSVPGAAVVSRPDSKARRRFSAKKVFATGNVTEEGRVNDDDDDV